MIIKKFQAKTENDAVEAAKKELGSAVVIMNVRKVKRKGPFGFLLPQLTEVTVALEEESEQKVQSLRKNTDSQNGNAVKAEKTAESRHVAEGELQGQKNFERQLENSMIEEKLDSLHSLLEQQLKKPEEETEEAPEEEIKEDEMSRFIKLVYNTMLDNEVDEKYANLIIDEMEKNNKPGTPFDHALADVYQKMILKFGNSQELTESQKGPKVVFFIGPTGVGKTTTIAKIAAEYQLDKKKKVALLTADTYRIAAAEQLRTYAGILEVPFRVIYSAEEISQAVRDFQDYDYIMVDTAGHAHQNEDQREIIKGLIHAADGLTDTDVFLVLSATTKYNDLKKIVDAYREVTDYRLIFTKLDETEERGNMFNIRLYTGAEICYVTCGQNVPDDLESFNPQKTVKLLLGGRKDARK
ncbi:MAG: flagellar biosynthesis protein FlhF [Suilimivivens sp.]|jgi:flagellar biosynthesis protein flhF|uniref:flagellar biosynthesis protein FlhF n=1 Tax=Suilimivivens sp. TaxID=2981669 RepID=UPI000E57A4E0|nr:flagellar biosynthesis protein FlhF [Lachnospiraceae bacterium OM04-12BH]